MAYKTQKPHMRIPLEDSDWAMEQKPAVQRLWWESWRADPYGSRWMQLNTSLKRAAFMSAKKALSEKGLFLFKPMKSMIDGRETVCWQIQNLHGVRVKEFWEEAVENREIESTGMDYKSMGMDNLSMAVDDKSMTVDSISCQSQSQQGVQNPSRTLQEHFNNTTEAEVSVCVFEKYKQRLHENGVYIESSKFKPLLRAASECSEEELSRAIAAWLEWAKNAPLRNVYGSLREAIVSRYSARQ